MSLSVSAKAESLQKTLNQYISDLQKNPNDNALREKIIKHVQEMKPEPAIPEEARKHFIEGGVLLKGAKAQKGYDLAVDAYYNYGVALELSGRLDDAVTAFKLYITTNPGELEARKAQDKIYEIPAKKKLAGAEKTADLMRKNKEEAKARLEKEAKAKIESVEGEWLFEDINNKNRPDVASGYFMKIYKGENSEWVIEVYEGQTLNNFMYFFDIRQSGRNISFKRTCRKRGCDQSLNTNYYNLTLSPDGTKLVGSFIDYYTNRTYEEVLFRR